MTATAGTRLAYFGRLEITWDRPHDEPEQWTTDVARWAASLLPLLPQGPVLDLGDGACHVGLLAVAGTRRPLVCLADSEGGEDVALANARRNGLAEQVTVVGVPAATDDRGYALVLGPVGGPVAQIAALRVAARFLGEGGALLLPLTGHPSEDAGLLARAHEHGLTETERRDLESNGAVLFRRSSDVEAGLDDHVVVSTHDSRPPGTVRQGTHAPSRAPSHPPATDDTLEEH
ncbi:class I SAM-dependent methyltransferase [Nocardioides bruguierae]|uniref:Class I SAM-dependent methyltransferase n=1 Tax=Nocardioides bruguierae TaxID=2945102 RepID=A0A9X2IH65_9ACTN|nr:class I SAM-dependent methyltransferase [Nocardioides bruguierae]MCM0622733.1 class I SAM-dependent methyltransferase [Nocardioides bruguierae]